MSPDERRDVIGRNPDVAARHTTEALIQSWDELNIYLLPLLESDEFHRIVVDFYREKTIHTRDADYLLHQTFEQGWELSSKSIIAYIKTLLGYFSINKPFVNVYSDSTETVLFVDAPVDYFRISARRHKSNNETPLPSKNQQEHPGAAAH